LVPRPPEWPGNKTNDLDTVESREVPVMRYGQLVMGPAGSGKSTYCSTMVKHCENIKRTVHVVNLDPAAEHFNYPVEVGRPNFMLLM